MDKNGLIHVDVLDGLGVPVEPSYFEVDRVGVQPEPTSRRKVSMLAAGLRPPAKVRMFPRAGSPEPEVGDVGPMSSMQTSNVPSG